MNAFLNVLAFTATEKCLAAHSQLDDIKLNYFKQLQYTLYGNKLTDFNSQLTARQFLFLVLMKDRCKLFCRVAGTMSYYQLQDRVVDGTPCGPDTYDICVQGLCRVPYMYSYILHAVDCFFLWCCFNHMYVFYSSSKQVVIMF